MDGMVKRVAVLLLALLGVAACGDPVVVVSDVDNISPAPKVPPWAKVAPEQIAEAKKHGVPVAFEEYGGGCWCCRLDSHSRARPTSRKRATRVSRLRADAPDRS